MINGFAKKSAPRLLINISRSLRCAGWPVRGEVRARCVWATSLGVDYRIQTKETRNKARNVSQASIDYTSIACCLFALESLIKEKRSRARASCEKRKAGEKEESAKIRLHQVKSAKHLFVLCPYNASKCNYNRLALIPIACSLITPPNVCRKTLKVELEPFGSSPFCFLSAEKVRQLAENLDDDDIDTILH